MDATEDRTGGAGVTTGINIRRSPLLIFSMLAAAVVGRHGMTATAMAATLILQTDAFEESLDGISDASFILDMRSSGSTGETFYDDEAQDNDMLTWNLSSPDPGGGMHYVRNLSHYMNLTREQLMELERDENPIRDPLSIAIPMTLIYSLILVSGLLGNISTCVVIARTSYMHTATNYYLFSLAMSDLLLLISGLPQEIYHIWIKYPYVFGEAFCVIRGLAAETSANATVLTITAFTVERFVAIVYPLKSHKLSQLSRVVRMIGIIWLVAFCLALPQAAQFGVLDHMSRYNPNMVLIKGAWCTLVREIFPYAFQISICVFFAIPMTIITVLYVLIGLKLRRSRKGPLNSNRGSQEINVEPRTQNRHSQSHVIRMLVAVVVAFFICWAPFHAQRLLALYGKSQEVPSDLFMIIYQGLTHVSGILYYLSTCVNPILYHIMSNKFRQAFKDTMSHLCGRTPPRGLHHRTYSAMSYSHRSSRIMHYASQRNGSRNNPNSLRHSNFPNRQKAGEMLTKVSEHSEKSPEIEFPISNGNIGAVPEIPTTPNCPCTCQCKSRKHKSQNRGGCLVTNNGTNPTNGTKMAMCECDCADKISFTKEITLNGPRQDCCQQDVSDCSCSCNTSLTICNSSPIEKEPMIPMTTINKSRHRNSTPRAPFVQLDPHGKTKGVPSLRSILRLQKKDRSSLGAPKEWKFLNSRNLRHTSDPSLPTAFAVTLLDSKGKSKTMLHRPRTNSGVGVGVQETNFENLEKCSCKASCHSHTSVDSGKSHNTNTISNSSLQDMDDVEFTSEELAGYMAELNLNMESPPTKL